jgi:hypothetical protein
LSAEYPIILNSGDKFGKGLCDKVLISRPPAAY